jgi:hypothetical protein
MKKEEVRLEELDRQELKKLKERVKEVEGPLHLSDPLPTNLIKSYYTLRYLRTRDFKIKLLHTLNFFRSV